MSETEHDLGPLTFCADGPLDAVVARVAEATGAQPEPPRPVERTWLDSFDWRLFGAGERLVAEPGPEGVRLWWTRGERLHRAIDVPAAPRFARDLQGPAGVDLGKRLDVRALLPRVTVAGQAVPLQVRDGLGKAVVHVEVAALAVGEAALPVRVAIRPVRGHDDRARGASYALQQADLRPAEPLLEVALAAIGARPGDYDAKVELAFADDEPAQRAVRRVLRGLLDVVVANEAGTRDDLDSEFLHDLRVAVRKTRSVLGQLARVFPADAVAVHKEALRWLGQVTSPLRDLDVFLLDLPGFEADVGRLGAVRELIAERHATARDELVAVLDSDRYRETIESWRAFLAEDSAGPDGRAPIDAVVRARIRKLAKKARQGAAAIDAETPPEALHDLRKLAKKLRYLTELFASRFDPAAASDAAKRVKALQSKLGTLQDLAVQGPKVRGIAEALLARGDVDATDLMRAGALVDRLERKRLRLRDALAEGYDAQGLREAYKQLLGSHP
ncbi:MAG: CHAD domain-containing protein [Myxococcota bacterium]